VGTDGAPVRWGIVATGAIARTFATDLAKDPDSTLVAVGSRNAAKAAEFAGRFGAERSYGSYAELAADTSLDAVYVATPHSQHAEVALAVIGTGTAVLCEKPLTLNGTEAITVANEARRRNVFCMEAMWTRFLPAIARVRELVADGAIGEVRQVSADFGTAVRFDPAHRMFDIALGGGALLDLGVYPLSFASMLLGQPAAVRAVARLAPTGADVSTAVLATYLSGAQALLSCSAEVDSGQEATVAGTLGRIHVHRPFWHPTVLTLHRAGREVERIALPATGLGYVHEAAEVVRCLREGLTESPVMPLDETVTVMRTMDEIRAQIGVRYAADEEPGEGL
jgi:predicted dehydrogenase